jgi:hypothetical protein
MKVLIDENLPIGLKRLLSGHEVQTLRDLGWRTVKNGALLDRADGVFDVMVTADRSIPQQQNLSRRTLSLVVLPFNRWRLVRELAPAIQAVLAKVPPRTLVRIARDGSSVSEPYPEQGGQTQQPPDTAVR